METKPFKSFGQSDLVEKLQNSGVLLCLNVPDQRVELGIDCSPSWVVGPKFKGIKLIPIGPHFVFYNSIRVASTYFPEDQMADPKHSDPVLESSPKIGFWMWIEPGDIVVKEWNPDAEDFMLDSEMQNVENFKQGVRQFDFDAFLGTYPIETLSEWNALSKYITKPIMQKLSPLAQTIHASDSSFMNLSDKRYNLDMNKLDKQLKQQRKQLLERGISSGIFNKDEEQFSPQSHLPLKKDHSVHIPFFSHIPRKPPSNLNPQQLTDWNLDRTTAFEHLVQAEYPNNPSGLLGELQFAFVSFLMGQTFDGFEQWKQLLLLLFSCERGLKTFPSFFAQFITVVHSQLRRAPPDFFLDILSQNNFLVSSLTGFFELLNDPFVDKKLMMVGLKFKQLVEERFKYQFDQNGRDEEDEEAPMIVDEVFYKF